MQFNEVTAAQVQGEPEGERAKGHNPTEVKRDQKSRTDGRNKQQRTKTPKGRRRNILMMGLERGREREADRSSAKRSNCLCECLRLGEKMLAQRWARRCLLII